MRGCESRLGQLDIGLWSWADIYPSGVYMMTPFADSVRGYIQLERSSTLVSVKHTSSQAPTNRDRIDGDGGAVAKLFAVILRARISETPFCFWMVKLKTQTENRGSQSQHLYVFGNLGVGCLHLQYMPLGITVFRTGLFSRYLDIEIL